MPGIFCIQNSIEMQIHFLNIYDIFKFCSEIKIYISGIVAN